MYNGDNFKAIRAQICGKVSVQYILACLESSPTKIRIELV